MTRSSTAISEKKLGTLTHKNLPLAIFLEEADLGYAAWSGSRTEKASNGDIISSLVSALSASTR